MPNDFEHTPRDRFWPVLLLGVALTAATVRAKSVDFSAHFDSEAYWSSHAIYLARVTDISVTATPNGAYVTTFVPIKIIAGSVAATNRSFQSYPASPMIDGFNGDRPDNFPMGASSDATPTIIRKLWRRIPSFSCSWQLC